MRYDKRDFWLIGILILLISNVIIGVHYYKQGKDVALLNERLSKNTAALVIADSIIKVDSTMLSIASVQSDSILTKRGNLRDHIKVVHDTVYSEPDSGSNDIEQVISDNPQIAKLIITDDSTINALKRVNQDQGKVINDLYIKGTLLYQRIEVLEKAKSPPRISRGFQLGVGYCQSPQGGNICGYVGYGVSVRF